MNLTYHLIRKDLRALRWGLLLWLAACVLHLGLRLAQLARGNVAKLDLFWGSLETGDRWDYGAVYVLPILLIPWLLHLDPVRGRLAFWKTVPIGRGRLLAAKAIPLVGFFVLVPLVCEAVYFVSAGLSVVLGAALVDWVWRYLPGIAAVTLGCAFTRTLKVGAPAVVVCVLAAVFLFQWPVGHDRGKSAWFLRTVPKRPAVVAARAGAKIGIDADSTHFNRTNFTGDGSTSGMKEERLSVAVGVRVTGLPDDVVVGYVKVDVEDLQLPDRVVTGQDTSETFAYFASSGLPEQEQRSQMGRNFRVAEGDLNLYAATSSYLRMSSKDVPAAGLPVEGIVRVYLARRHLVATLPIKNGAAWKPGVHRFGISRVTNPGGTQTTFHTRMEAILADPEGHTGGLAINPLTAFVVWAEHNTRPDRTVLQTISGGAWRSRHTNVSSLTSRSGMINMSDLGATDATRSWRRVDFDHNLDPIDLRDDDDTPLSLARFAEEDGAISNWHLKIVAYDDFGVVELPLKAIANMLDRGGETNDAETVKAPSVSLGTLLDEVSLPAKPTREEARQLFAAIAERADHRSEASIRAHENKMLSKLAALGPDHVEVLLAAASAAVRPQVPYEGSPRGRARWLISVPKAPIFWRRVLMAACDLARPEDKALFLRYHTPQIDLRRAIERMGWEVDAIPGMSAIAMKELVPAEWVTMLGRNSGLGTREAILAQIRQRTVSPWNAADLIAKSAVPGRETASALWSAAIANTGNLEELQPSFALAAKNGVEVIPRDLLRLVRLRSEDWGRPNWVAYRSLQASFVESFSLRSDCPPGMAEAAAWLEKNAHALAFNIATGRYELPGKTAAVPDTGAWGSFVDTMGLGRAGIEGGDLLLTSGGAKPSGPNTFARMIREAEGDFTAEVTVEPAFALAAGHEGGAYQGAGLLLIADETRWIRWEHGLSRNADGHELREETMRGGKSTVLQRGTEKWVPGKPVRLRLSRHGDLFTTAWKQEGGEWLESAAFRNAGWPRKVRVGAMTNNNVARLFTARFQGFTLGANSAAPARENTPIAAHPTGAATESGVELGGWGKVENPIGAGVFSVEGNSLSIDVAPRQSEYNIQGSMTAPRVMQEVDGDFTLEVTLEPTPRLDWNSAEVLLTSGADFNFRTGVALGWGTKRGFLYELVERGLPVSVTNLDAKPDLTKPLRIRLQRRGSLLSIAHQKSDGEWAEFYPVYLSGWPSKIEAGVVALNTSKEPFTARFTDIRLTRDAAR